MDDNLKLEQVQGESSDVEESFQCSFEDCGKTFSSLAILCTHEAVCSKAGITPRASCEICGSRTRKLKQHMLLHEPPQHQCPACKKMFHFRYNMTSHLKIHAKVLDPLDGASNKGLQLLLEMVAAPPRRCQKRKLRPESFSCTVCPSVFKKKQSLQYHMNIHEGLTPYKCRNEGCDEAFANHQDRRNHERDCQGESSKKACTDCGLQINIKSLSMHRRTVHKVLQKDRKPVIKDKLYPCGQCSTVLKSEHGLRSHENQHKGIKPYPCRNEGCRESFTGSGIRTNHEKLCIEAASICPVCGLALANGWVRQDHMASFHKDDTMLTEMLKLESPDDLSETVDPNELPDGRKKCPECGKILSKRGHIFEYHMNKHKGVQPYTCVKCSKAFFSKPGQARHERNCLAGLTACKDSDTESIETPKERKQKSNKSKVVPKQCELCKQMLRSEQIYERHMAMHNGAGFYLCKYKDCAESFHTYRERQQHEVERHNNMIDAPQLECPDCGERCATRQHLKSHQENEHQSEEEYAELESTITIKEEKIQWDDDDDESVGT